MFSEVAVGIEAVVILAGTVAVVVVVVVAAVVVAFVVSIDVAFDVVVVVEIILNDRGLVFIILRYKSCIIIFVDVVWPKSNLRNMLFCFVERRLVK